MASCLDLRDIFFGARLALGKPNSIEYPKYTAVLWVLLAASTETRYHQLLDDSIDTRMAPLDAPTKLIFWLPDNKLVARANHYKSVPSVAFSKSQQLLP